MKRRPILLLATFVAMMTLAALGSSKPATLLVLDWAAKARTETPPVAVVIEMGLKDKKPTAWLGRARVAGARVVHREGLRFRKDDRLVEPDGWKASSFFPPSVMARNPATPGRLTPVAAVGVVLHLADVQPDATLTLDPRPGESRPVVIALKGVLAGQTRLFWDGQAAVRRLSSASPVVTAKTEDDFPAAAYGPDGTLWSAYVSYTVRDESRRIVQPAYKEQPADFRALYTPAFADQLFVKHFRDGKWSEPLAVTEAGEDLARCAIAVDGNGTAWVVYSANRQGNFDIYVRSVRLENGQPAARMGTEQRLTTQPGPDLTPVMCTDQAGQVWLAFQSWDEKGRARIALFRCREGKWTEGPALPAPAEGENRWHPALATGPNGQVAVAYDCYRDDDYDVYVAIVDGEQVTSHAVAASGLFEARPALAYDPRGRLWIAYEEGPEKWGKDFGALDDEKGNPLYNERSLRVVCLEGGKLFRPAAVLPTSQSPRRHPNQQTVRYAYPKVGIDGKGRLWLTYRQKFGAGGASRAGSYWLSFARRLDGDHWTEPMEVHYSDGLLDSRPVLLPHPFGGLLILHNTDGRYITPDALDNQVYASVVDLPGEPVEPHLVRHQPGMKKERADAEERVRVQGMRDYRIEAAGAKYQLLRGEFHRHTEISYDGGMDGSLEDMFRYAIDTASLDWIGNGDHDNGNGREYTWWLVQKFTDAYHTGPAFVPLFSYERSVNYPHGHRNCLFARRGVRPLPRLSAADPEQAVVNNIHADDTKMLYRYLRELDGICASHSSATQMGTDWRDHDAVVEPIVEIYQGDRNSYEFEGAPRTGHDPKSGKLPAQFGVWHPDGFIINALHKGYRLGFQSSSDHLSTHISFCIALAEDRSRAAILAALKKRHCYGATDNIIADVRSGDHLMGDEFKTTAAPTLNLTVVGTGPLARIDILKDSAPVAALQPGKRAYQGTWTDPTPAEGVHYYYVRVMQADGELAWTSPMWIDYAKPR